ncbi:MAG: phage integrase N-terminal SAM-like domain-containing protein, partial [Oscillospiraceae bacterium]|nr:phage integrase N-terminal SAM-like domain-containing protein [Oscillospiraceae bacterium]
MTRINRDDCPFVLAEFLNYMETIKNLSGRTVDGYYIDLRTFLRFLKRERGMTAAETPFNEIKIEDITLDDIKTIRTADVYEYLHMVTREFENNPNTRARKVSSLRAFFKYLTVKSHQLEFDPVKNIEVPSLRKSLPKFLNLEESRGLLETPEGE